MFLLEKKCPWRIRHLSKWSHHFIAINYAYHRCRLQFREKLEHSQAKLGIVFCYVLFVCVLFYFLISNCSDADSCTWKTSQDIVQKLNATPKFCFSWLLPPFYPPTAEYIVSKGSLDAPSFQWSVCKKFSLWSVSAMKCYFVDDYDGNYYGSGFLNFPIAFNHKSDSADSCVTQITDSSQINILISNCKIILFRCVWQGFYL